MDIKNVLRNILPVTSSPITDVKKKELVQGENKTSADRDPGSAPDQQNGESARRQLSEEELKEAIQHFEALPGVKESGLKFRLVRNDGIAVVYVEDRNGKVVRRIPEAELSLVKARSQEKKSTGHILNKAM
jgi:uncharacterized FlaG/YvyC family protein